MSGPTERYLFLWMELRRRWCKPWGEPTFVIYFLLAVIGFAGLGLWIEVYKYITANSPASSAEGMRTAVFTLFPALIGTTALDSIWAAEGRKDGRAFATLGLVVAIVFALVIQNSDMPDACALPFGIVAWLVSLLIWWISNADNPNLFRQDPPPRAAIGGDDPTKPLGGNLDDFQY